MMKLAKALVVTMLLGSLFFVGAAPAASANGISILRFNTMVGIPPTLTGTLSVAPLRGIKGGGLPWTIGEANGSLTADGRLKVEVQGLVLAAGQFSGSNPISSFRALVSCVNSDGTFDNILTDAFPATTGPASSGGGDADIETTVTLPQPCIAPIVFVTSPTGAWFSATGN
jgi:hypothetical protein